MERTYISFDWAIKKFLRQKDNFDILEGFLSELLCFDLTIQQILESESNQEDVKDKFNKVDILVETAEKELILVELQYDSEVDYFQRMLYGTSKLITSFISQGETYSKIKKVYSINILYFSLGEGTDYLYTSKNNFIGVNNGKELACSVVQQKHFQIEEISDIFPEYYLIQVNNFNIDTPKNAIEEWVYFLKSSQIPDTFKARGIDKAREKMKYEQMSLSEKQGYDAFVEDKRVEASVKMTNEIIHSMELEKREKEGIKKGMQEGIKKGKEEGIQEGVVITAKNMLAKNIDIKTISECTGLSEQEIDALTHEKG